MGEGRPDNTPADPGRLSPLQRAGLDYRRHTAGCPSCRTTDGGRCEEAARLWSLHKTLCDEAYAALAAAREGRF